LRKAEQGRFGSNAKPEHFAMLRCCLPASRPRRILFAPVTSRRPEETNAKRCLTLPAGVIKCATPQRSFVLARPKCWFTRAGLERHLSFHQLLPDEYKAQAREILGNG